MIRTRPRERFLPPSPYTGVEYIDDPAKMHAAMHTLKQKPLWVERTVDTETTGCRLFEDRLKVVQIGVEGLPVYVIQIERINESEWESLRKYLSEDRPGILQNGKFDLRMLAAAGLPLKGRVIDTCLRSKLYRLGNKEARHNLKAIVSDWCDYEIDKTQQRSFLRDVSREPLTQEQIVYAANDCVYVHAVYTQQKKGLAECESDRPGILAHVAREERLLPLLADLEVTGVYLNTVAIEVLATSIKQLMEAIEQELEPLLHTELKQIKLSFKVKPPFSPTKIKKEQLQAAFQIADDETNTLLKATLKHPAVKAVLRHRTLWRQLDFCRNIVKAQNSITGRLHPDHTQIENVQGTLSTSRTQIEALTRLAQANSGNDLCLLKAATRHVLLRVSFPLLELRLLAYFASEGTLFTEIEQGQCPIQLLADTIAHTNLGASGYSNDVLAQALWHGHGILGQTGAYLQRWLYSELGIVLDLKQLKVLQTLLPKKYPSLERFHASVHKWDYGDRATLLGVIRLWRQITPKEARSFVVWTSHNEILKECAQYSSSFCSKSGGRLAFIDKEHFYLETPLRGAETAQAALKTALATKLGVTFPQVKVKAKVEVISNV